MMTTHNRQVERTRDAIKTAFAELVFLNRYDEIRMSDVAQKANVGRSTLYVHFPDKDAILLDNLAPFLNDLATSLEGPIAQPKVEAVLHHIWSHRDRGRKVIFGPTGQKLESYLASQITETLPDRSDTLAPSFLANSVAASIFAILRTWLQGEASGTVPEIARHICLSSQAISKGPC